MTDRVHKVTSISGIELHIAAKREWSALIFLPIWLAGWSFGGIMAMKSILYPGPSTPHAFLWLWLMLWALGEAWTIYHWLWTAFGKEIVRIRDGELTIKRDILGRGRSRSFPIATVTNLRTIGFFPAPSNRSNSLADMNDSDDAVGFESQGQQQRFGIELMLQEAQLVVQELKPYLS
jgi:hypothetical protein